MTINNRSSTIYYTNIMFADYDTLTQKSLVYWSQSTDYCV